MKNLNRFLSYSLEKEAVTASKPLFLFPETANFVNMLFEALVNVSYMPQPIVEPTLPIAGPTTPKVIPTQQPTANSTTPPEKPRKTSISEDVLTPRVQAEVKMLFCWVYVPVSRLTNINL